MFKRIVGTGICGVREIYNIEFTVILTAKSLCDFQKRARANIAFAVYYQERIALFCAVLNEICKGNGLSRTCCTADKNMLTIIWNENLSPVAVTNEDGVFWLVSNRLLLLFHASHIPPEVKIFFDFVTFEPLSNNDYQRKNTEQKEQAPAVLAGLSVTL